MKIPGLGALKFHCYTRPLDALDVQLGRRRLPAVARSIEALPPLAAVPAGARTHTVAYLTGDRFLYQTVFSAYSLVKAAGPQFRFRIVSDGTLSERNVAFLHRVFPGAIDCEPSAQQEARIESLFPIARFPALRQSRREGALFRKLLDVHGGVRGWTLFLDSDTFFHRRPDALLQCLAESRRPCFMLDHWSNYGFSPAALEQFTGTPILRNVNSGVVGLASETIDWERLESWLAEMIRRRGRVVFYEQGLTAVLLSRQDSVALPAKDYVLSPSRRETAAPVAAFHHYAGESKYRFLRYNVPRVLFAD